MRFFKSAFLTFFRQSAVLTPHTRHFHEKKVALWWSAHQFGDLAPDENRRHQRKLFIMKKIIIIIDLVTQKDYIFSTINTKTSSFFPRKMMECQQHSFKIWKIMKFWIQMQQNTRFISWNQTNIRLIWEFWNIVWRYFLTGSISRKNQSEIWDGFRGICTIFWKPESSREKERKSQMELLSKKKTIWFLSLHFL